MKGFNTLNIVKSLYQGLKNRDSFSAKELLNKTPI